MAVESIVNLTVGKVGELLVKEAKFLYGVEDEVRRMQAELIMMNSFLIDMEALDNEVGDERTRNTAREIRNIVYNAEDVIESYVLKVDRAENKNDLFKRYMCFCQCLANTHTVGSEIEAITVKITETMDRLKRYRGENGLTKVVGQGLNKTAVWRPAAYSHSKEDHVVGLDEDINKLVSSLTNDNRIQVLSIVGMGGCGKSTLTRKLYNHERVKQCFDCVAWVTVSQQYVAQHVLLDILKKAGGDAPTNLNEGSRVVVDVLHEHLESRKYLIVLDDVWTKQALEEIVPALPLGNQESKIIVTTRFREVVDYPDLKSFVHEPKALTPEQSWELFQTIALSNREGTVELDDFEALGKEMLKKCKGLPLAVVALAGLLAKKETVDEWDKVKDSMSSRLMDTGRGTHSYGAVKEMLTLSYNDLPRDLKPCFLYLGLFPEDTEIPAGMLTRMWIAEGFISSQNLHERETLEDLARDYLNELIGRCVVRVASRNYDGKPKTVDVHDLMRDLCNAKAKELDFLQIICDTSSDLDTTHTQPRRTVVHSYDKTFRPFSKTNGHLRSLFLFARANVGILHYVEDIENPTLSIQPIIKSFKLLRVLNLVGIDTSDGTLPTEIGRLIHLRYFGLRVTNIAELPSSISNLRNLLTLDYRGLLLTPFVPNVLWKIEGLRHIYLPFDRSEMSDMRFDTLKHLQTLWVGGGDWMIQEMPRLSRSVQKLHIEGIENSEQLQIAFQCPSIMSDCLHTLYLDWETDTPTPDSNSNEEGDEVVDENDDDEEEEEEGEEDGDEDEDKDERGDVLELRNIDNIINARRLRKLGLRGVIDDTLKWFQFPSGISKLDLTFTRLQAEETLAGLGRLPKLKVLNLSRDSYLGSKWSCKPGSFPQLKELDIFDLPNLVEWAIAKDAMRQLTRLGVGDCKKLSALPKGLKFITTLQELLCQYMTPQFYKRIQENGKDFHIIRHIPVIKYHDD